ncbi:hypothetical protein Tco_0378272 [Tanacetum coccineum]
MSDSEDSTVTYTEISSPYEDLSDIGSPGAEGPIFQDPPSPDYVPGPEEPEQAPPSPINKFWTFLNTDFECSIESEKRRELHHRRSCMDD